MRRLFVGCAVACVAVLVAPGARSQTAFPYDRDMVLDARAMRGSKRLPVLSIDQNGRTQIDLWCKRGRGQATIAGATITIAVAAMNDEPCTPERAQADDDILDALSQVTGWSARGDVVMLTGRKPLRLRLATN